MASAETVKYCFNPVWAPYDFYRDGKHQGIFRDYLDLLSQRSGLTFEAVPTPTWSDALAGVKDGKCDFLSGAVRTEEREKFLSFTGPYFSMYHVLIAKPNKP